jgi:hypothetical protein
MSSNVVIMVLGIVLITTIGRIYMAKHGLVGHRGRKGPDAIMTPAATADADRMREEIKTLKERIAVLERLATDTNSAAALDREIEKLR